MGSGSWMIFEHTALLKLIIRNYSSAFPQSDSSIYTRLLYSDISYSSLVDTKTEPANYNIILIQHHYIIYILTCTPTVIRHIINKIQLPNSNIAIVELYNIKL